MVEISAPEKYITYTSGPRGQDIDIRLTELVGEAVISFDVPDGVVITNVSSGIPEEDQPDTWTLRLPAGCENCNVTVWVNRDPSTPDRPVQHDEIEATILSGDEEATTTIKVQG